MSIIRTDVTREKIDALQERVADLKSSADQARRETSERVRARIDQAQADIAARQQAMHDKAGRAAAHAQGQWQAMQADAAAKVREWQDRIDRKRDEADVKRAERHAEIAADDADAVDFAVWTVDAARLAGLDAIDARARADERAAASRAG